MTAVTKQERIEELEAAVSYAMELVSELDRLSTCCCCKSRPRQALFYLNNVLCDKLV